MDQEAKWYHTEAQRRKEMWQSYLILIVFSPVFMT